MKTNPQEFRVHSAVLRAALKKLAPIASNKVLLESVNGNVLVGVSEKENTAELICTDFTTVRAKVKIPVFASGTPQFKTLQIEQPQEDATDLVNDGRKNYNKKTADVQVDEDAVEVSDSFGAGKVVFINLSDSEADEVETIEPDMEEEINGGDDEEEYPDFLQDWHLHVTENEDDEPPFYDEGEAPPFTEPKKQAAIPYSEQYDYYFLLPVAITLALLDGDSMITVNSANPELIVIEDLKGNSFRIATTDPKDYPTGLFPTTFPQSFCEVSAEELRLAASSIGQFVSQDNLRPAMTGIYLDPVHEKIKVVGTDAHLLAVKSIQCKSSNNLSGTILPTIVFKLLPQSGSVLIFALNNGHVLLSSNEMTIDVTPIDSRYPEYVNVVPPKDSTRLSISIGKNEVVKLLKKANHLADKAAFKVVLQVIVANETVRLYAPIFDEKGVYYSIDTMLPAKLTVIPPPADAGKFDAPIDGVFEIAFNAQMMLKLITQFVHDDSVVFEISEPHRAIVVNRSQDSLSLIMPMMLQK